MIFTFYGKKSFGKMLLKRFKNIFQLIFCILILYYSVDPMF